MEFTCNLQYILHKSGNVWWSTCVDVVSVQSCFLDNFWIANCFLFFSFASFRLGFFLRFLVYCFDHDKMFNQDCYKINKMVKMVNATMQFRVVPKMKDWRLGGFKSVNPVQVAGSRQCWIRHRLSLPGFCWWFAKCWATRKSQENIKWAWEREFRRQGWGQKYNLWC